MAAGRSGLLAAVLIYAFIMNFLGGRHLYEHDCLALLSSHTSQKHFGHGHSTLFNTYIYPGMENQATNKHLIKVDQQRGEQLIITFCLLLASDIH